MCLKQRFPKYAMASGWQGSTEQPPTAALGLAASLQSAASRRNPEAESGWLAPKPGEVKGDSEAHMATQGWLWLGTLLCSVELRGRTWVSPVALIPLGQKCHHKGQMHGTWGHTNTHSASHFYRRSTEV